MTIDEAIEILRKFDDMAQMEYISDLPKAIRLGIEALRRIPLYRKGMFTGLGDKLPGETEE